MRIYYFIHLTGRDHGNTGIQRVVRNLGRRLQHVEGVELVPVRWCSRQDAVVHVEQEFVDMIAIKGGPVFSTSPHVSKPVHETANPAAEDWLLIPEVPHLRSHDPRFPELAVLEPLGYARRVGLQTALVFHDLLPLTHRKLLEPGTDELIGFTAYAQSLLLADLILPNSRTSASDLVGWFERYAYPKAVMPRIVPVLLPEEMAGTRPEPAAPQGIEAGGVGEAGGQGPVQPAAAGRKRAEFLALGTVCPRKNQVRAMEALNRVLARRSDLDLHLHVVGSVDHGLASIVADQINSSKGAIHVYGYLEDDRLLELTRRVRATVFVSLAEGYGLPVAESLWLNKPCLCSDLGSMAEIAVGGGCLTVDPTDIAGIAAALERLADDEECYQSLLRGLSQRKLRTWEDYAVEVASAMRQARASTSQIAEAAISQRALRLREPANLSAFYIDACEFSRKDAYPSGNDNSLFNGAAFNYRSECHRDNEEQVLFYGPYIDLEPAEYRLHFRGTLRGRLRLRIMAEAGRVQIKDMFLSSFTDPVRVVLSEPARRFELVASKTPDLQFMDLYSIFVERVGLPSSSTEPPVGAGPVDAKTSEKRGGGLLRLIRGRTG